MATLPVPTYVQGEVVKGFGRGSKELGIPTANFSRDAVDQIPAVKPSVHYGFAQVGTGAVHKMVMNIGYVPFYKNQALSAEVHILHEFDDDFYGQNLKIVILGYLREERNYASVQALIEAIQNDIREASGRLDDPDRLAFKNDPFFLT